LSVENQLLTHRPTTEPRQAEPSDATLAGSSRIPSLDGLRAVSVMMVMVFHAFSGGAYPRVITAAVGVIGDGGLGVFTFYIISGFLITTLLLREERRSGRIRLTHFYVRRAFRILPAYYVFLLGVGLLTLCGRVIVNPKEILQCATFTRMYFFGSRSDYLGHTWSLCAEEHFYLIWPAMLVLATRRSTILFGLVVIVLGPFVRWYELTPSHGALHRMAYIFGWASFDILMMGSLPAIFWSSPKFKSLLSRAFRFRMHLALPVAALIIDSPLLNAGAEPRIIQAIASTVRGLAAAIVVFYCVTHHRGAVGRILDVGWIKKIGLISFSVYLWQQIFLLRLLPRHVVNSNVAVNFAIVMAIGFASYYFIELPFLRLRVSLLRDALPSGPAI